MTTTPDTLAKLAPKLSDKLITLLKCLPEAPFKEHLKAEIDALAAQALPAAEPVKLDVMPIFWKCFRNFPSTAGALTHTVWKDGIDIDKLSAPMQTFCDALIQAAQAPAGWQPIETAPKDGRLFICWVAAERWSSPDGQESSYAHDVSQVDFCWWRPCFEGVPDSDYFDNASGQIGDRQYISHWMPLPAPPAALPQPQPQSAQAKGDAA